MSVLYILTFYYIAAISVISSETDVCDANRMNILHSYCEYDTSYSLDPNKVGKIVKNIDLKENLSQNTINNIIEDSKKHKLLIFKSQGVINATRQMEIGKWFGELDEYMGHTHIKQPSKYLTIVSNDKAEG